MAFPGHTPTNGTDAQTLLIGRAAALGLAQPSGGLSQIDFLAEVVGNLLTEVGALTVSTAAIAANAVTEAKLATALAGTADGLGVMRVARATFDPSATVGQRAVQAHNLGVTIPISAVICGGFLVVHTAFTSGGSTAQIAFHAQSANDLITAAAVSGAPYSTIGRKAIVPKANTPESTGIELSAARALTATVTVEALTAGKATLFVYYLVGAVSA
jgi:hypothetical protein